MQEERYEANSDLVCLGGMFIIRRVNSPVANLLNLSAISLMMGPLYKIGPHMFDKGQEIRTYIF